MSPTLARRLALASLVAAPWGCRRATPPTPAAPAAPPGGGAWAAVTSQANADGLLPREAALRAFALQFGPVPGVGGVPARDGSVPTCATGAIRQVVRHWASLDEAQRAAVRRALATGTTAPETPALGAVLHSNAATDAQRAADADIERARRELGNRLGVELRDDIHVNHLAAQRAAGGTGSAATYAWSAALGRQIGNNFTSTADCRIDVGAEVLGFDPRARYSALAHEVFHCFQLDARSLAQWTDAPDWVLEGSAAWVGEALAGGSAYSRRWWDTYLGSPSSNPALPDLYTLAANDYGAIGFYSHLHAPGSNDLWPRLLPAINQPSATSFASMVGSRHDLLATWASGALRRPAWGAAWDARGPGITGSARRPKRTAALARGAELRLGHQPTAPDLGVDPTSQRAFEVPVAPDVDVVEFRAAGYGRATFDGRGEVGWSGDPDVGMWCTRAGGCRCADGSAPRGGFRGEAPGAALTVALTEAYDRHSFLALRAVALEELCAADAGTDAGDAAEAGLPLAPVDGAVVLRGGHDPCLTGVWHVDREHELAEARRLFPPQVRVLAVRGDLTLSFDGRGAGRSEFVNYCIETEAPGAMGMRQKVIFRGDASGRYATSGGRLDTAGVLPRLQVETQVTVAGRRMNLPVPTNDAFAAGALPASTRYTCTETSLVFEGPSRQTRYRRAR